LLKIKAEFERQLKEFVKSLNQYIATEDGQWTIKGFIDVFKNVYTISSDTKIISKILEIHLFPQILKFAESNGYKLVLAQHQNYYPDLSFIYSADETVKFAIDLKTTYRLENEGFCNGFTLGSHGKYFINRTSKKNIQFPYNEYQGHFCLGIIYTRAKNTTIDETKHLKIDQLHSITSVIKDIQFFIAEKWKIASDKSGSGNTANIGSINNITDLINGNGLFAKLGEKWFDDYWMNYGKIMIADKNGKTKKLSTLKEFVLYKKGNVKLIVKRNGKVKKGKNEIDRSAYKKSRNKN
jgi:hypothetical protein